MSERKRLSDILHDSDRKSIADAWNTTVAAADFAPLPPGPYEVVAVCGELFTAKSGTAGYKLTFEVSYGDFKGRKIWHDIWLTPAALPLAKRDLLKIGITSLDQLERPLPARFQCKVKLALRKNDDGIEYNRVVSFECVGVEKSDPFAPPTEGAEGSAPVVDADAGDGHGDAWEPPANAPPREGLFSHGANSTAKNGQCPTPYDRGQRR